MRFALWFSFFPFLKRAFYDVRRSFRRTGALLRLWVTPEENPFLQRALRVEQRKRKPFLLVVVLMLAILLLNGGLWWLWTWILTQSPTLRDTLTSYELPRFLGGNLLGGVAIFTLTCCIWAAIFVCGSRASQNLRREMLGGTLEQLILLPQREERWLWLFRAQPMALALLIYACGLPVFTLAVFTGNWHFLDLFGLLFLFVAIGHMAPGWVPQQWQAKQFQGKQFDFRAWQAAVKLLQQEGKEVKGEAAQLETQRRMARLWEQMEPVSDTKTEDGKKRWLVGANALGGAANSGNNWRVFSWIFFFQLIMPGAMLMRAPSSPLRVWWDNVREALPRDITELAPAFPVTWPLLIERFLLAPLPFFAFALPPLLLYLPLWLARQIGGNLQLASQVSPSEIFWTPRRLRVRRVCVRWIACCALFMLLGYSWKTLIDDSVLALLMNGATSTSAWSLATLWTLCLTLGVVLGGEAKEKPFKRRTENELTNEWSSAQAWREAARVAVSYLAFSMAAYFAFCALGQQPFFNAPFLQRFVPVGGTVLAYLIADYGSSALQAALPEAQRGACKTLVLFWTLGLGLAALAHIASGAYYQKPFTFDQAPYVVLSPFVTLVALFRADLNGGVPWWIGPALQTMIGGVLLLWAALKTFGVPQVKTPVEAARDDDRLPAPLRWMMNVLTGIWSGIAAFFEGCMEIVRRADNGIVQWSKRFGNPILSDELQRRLRREHWPLGWAILFLIGVGGLAQGFYFAGASIQGRYVGGVALVATLILGFSSSLRLGLCFDRDRANGTLVFIFLTPLTEKEIAWGKLFANLIYSGGTLITVLPFLLVGAALELARGNWRVALTGALLYLFALSGVAYFSGLSLLGATWARKPAQGSSLALLIGLLCQCLFFLPPGVFVILSNTPGNAFYYFVGYVIFSLNLVVAFFSWRGALKLLRKQRYSDDVSSGKRTG